jgi:DNA-nicking Smr family endonuclease
MKPSDSRSANRPFKNLKALLETNHFRLSGESPAQRPPDAQIDPEPDPAEERRLFLEAMADVHRIGRDRHVVAPHRAIPPAREAAPGDSSIVSCLEKMIKTGEGFIIALTPEYIAGSGENVHPEIIRRLHQGQYAIQDYIDLHGLNVNTARQAFDEFMKSSTTTGKQGVLIVHGRGLSSAAEPVLKSNVVRWLTQGSWRKWVIAYSSARSCDGGAGATYVLLRTRRPMRQTPKKQCPRCCAKR